MYNENLELKRKHYLVHHSRKFSGYNTLPLSNELFQQQLLNQKHLQLHNFNQYNSGTVSTIPKLSADERQKRIMIRQKTINSSFDNGSDNNNESLNNNKTVKTMSLKRINNQYQSYDYNPFFDSINKNNKTPTEKSEFYFNLVNPPLENDILKKMETLNSNLLRPPNALEAGLLKGEIPPHKKVKFINFKKSISIKKI